MKIAITMVMHTLVKEPVELVRTLAGPETTFHIFLHSQIPEVEDAFMSLTDVPNIRLYQIGINQGLAKSWNQGLVYSQQENADVMMIMNDDVTANRWDMLRIAEAAMDVGHEYFMINGEGLHISANLHAGLQLALAAVTPLWVDKIGAFDEGFLMCYYEDVDLYRRCAIAGLKPYSIGETNILHLGGQTVQRSSQVLHQLQVAVPRNEQYYAKKWGGANGQETFDRPFNDPAFGVKIEFEDRHRPYPGHERTDLEELLAIE